MENNINEAMTLNEEETTAILKDAFATLEAHYGSQVSNDMKMTIPAIESGEIVLHTIPIQPQQWLETDIADDKRGYAILCNGVIDYDLDVICVNHKEQAIVVTPMTIYTKSDHKFNVAFYTNPAYYDDGNNNIIIFTEDKVEELVVLFIVKEYFKSPIWDHVQGVYYQRAMESEQRIADSINAYFMNQQDSNNIDEEIDSTEVDEANSIEEEEADSAENE